MTKKKVQVVEDDVVDVDAKGDDSGSDEYSEQYQVDILSDLGYHLPFKVWERMRRMSLMQHLNILPALMVKSAITMQISPHEFKKMEKELK